MNAQRAPTTRSLNLSLKHLRAVRAVVDCGNFTAAAAALGMTQPGVSRLVSQVERDLGLLLFVRTTRTVALTAPGREFVEGIARFLDDLDAQVASARSVGGQFRGRLVISCLLSLTHHMVPDTLAAYRRAQPNVEVHLREGLGAEVHEDVRSGIADFGIGNAVGLPDDMVAETVVRESCVALLPIAHRLTAKPELRLQDFAREQLVSLPPASGLRRLIDGLAAANAVSLNHMIVVEQFGSMFDVVAAGLGIAIVPPSALPRRLRGSLVTRPIASPPIVRSIGILRLRSRGLTPAAQAFLDSFTPRFARVSSPSPSGRGLQYSNW